MELYSDKTKRNGNKSDVPIRVPNSINGHYGFMQPEERRAEDVCKGKPSTKSTENHDDQSIYITNAGPEHHNQMESGTDFGHSRHAGAGPHLIHFKLRSGEACPAYDSQLSKEHAIDQNPKDDAECESDSDENEIEESLESMVSNLRLFKAKVKLDSDNTMRTVKVSEDTTSTKSSLRRCTSLNDFAKPESDLKVKPNNNGSRKILNAKRPSAKLAEYTHSSSSGA